MRFTTRLLGNDQQLNLRVGAQHAKAATKRNRRTVRNAETAIKVRSIRMVAGTEDVLRFGLGPPGNPIGQPGKGTLKNTLYWKGLSLVRAQGLPRQLIGIRNVCPALHKNVAGQQFEQ